MIGAVASVVAALVVAARLAYPRYFEWRALRRRPLGASGVVLGAEEITYARTGAPGVLLLHGGGDTPQVLGGLATHLRDAGFSVRVPLLSAHGRRLAELCAASANSWYREVEQEWRAMERQHPTVGVVGLSMGGALAVRLAAEQQRIPALVLLAPYLAMPDAIRRLAASADLWGWLLPYFPSLGTRSIHDPEAAKHGLGHGIHTPASLRALFDVATAGYEALPRVHAPTLVIQSREDNRISIATAESAFERLGSTRKQFVWVEGAGHVITVDYGHERVFQLTTEWLQAHLPAPAAGPSR